MMGESTADRLRVALDLADAGFDLMRQNLRRSNPSASAGDIEQLLAAWIRERPADCPGRARHLHLA